MLEPRDRKLLFDLLRPPDGYRLDAAIGTSYSLDILALLVTPLAFTLFDLESRDGKVRATPLALLESLRRHADRISVFCQAGQLQVPRRHRVLFGYLEQCVVPVTPRNAAGVFHPKLWVLRFEPEERSEPQQAPAVFRLICSSRNLTFDRSWDTVLTLEGAFRPRSKRLPRNRPLRDFLEALPGLALREVNPELGRRVKVLSEEIERVEFDCPAGFDAVHFLCLGLGGRDRSLLHERVDRLLVMSPFVTDGMLNRLAGMATRAILVSRAEELGKLREGTLSAFDPVFALDPAAEVEPDLLTEDQELVDLGEEVDPSSSPPSKDRVELAGLHAKVYVVESNKRATVWTGSANATDAAFGANVEFLTGLEGAVGRCGIDAILGDPQGQGFAALLQKFVPTGLPTPEDDAEQLQARFDELQRRISLLPLRVEVMPSLDPDVFDLGLVPGAAPEWSLGAGIAARCRPLSLGDAWFKDFGLGGERIEFTRVPFEFITSFIVFELSAVAPSGRSTRLFLLNLPLEGAPPDRKERLLLSLLRTPHQVMRYLLLLLSDDGWDARAALDLLDELEDGRPRAGSSPSSPSDLPLLEALVAALARQPRKLDQIERLLAELKSTPEGRAVIPDGLLDVWEPIWRVRQEHRDEPTR